MEDKQTRTFCGLLAKYKTMRGLNVAQMAKLLGVSVPTYHAMKKDVSRVSVKTLRRMRVALQIPVDELKEVI